MTNEEMLSVAEIVERLVARFHKQADDHEAKMVEHRAAFGARTKADAETIDRLHTERDGLLTQVQDMRAERERLRSENQIMRNDAEDGYAEAIKVLGDPIALSKERDALRAEVAELKTQLERLTSWAAKNQAARETLQTEIERLKSQTPKHPVKVGEHVAWCGSGFLTGTIKQVAEVRSDRAYRFTDDDVWSFALCEPCDPPTEATHDTPTGKQVAESVIRDDRKSEPMCVGDEVEVIGLSVPAPGSGMFTGTIAPIGMRGIAKLIHGTAGFVELDNGTRASIQDVRKVTT